MERILIVNNDLDTMNLLKSWLQRKKYDVEFTGKPEEVPHIIKKFNPNLLVVDVLREDVIEQVKKDEDTRNISVLLMTGYTNRKKTAEVNADDIIEKPFNVNVLENKIASLLFLGNNRNKNTAA